MNRIQFFSWALIALLIVAFSSPLYAESPSTQPKKTQDEAFKHYEAGKKLYEIGKFEEAIIEYQEAYQIDGKADFLYNIAQCYYRIGEISDDLESLKKAKFQFEQFLKKSPNTKYKKDIKEIIKNLEKDIELKEQEEKIVRKKNKEKEPPPPEPTTQQTASTQNVSPFNKATEDALRLILGRDYNPFLSSGLTLEGFLEVKRGKRNAWLGGYMMIGGTLLGAGGLLVLTNNNLSQDQTFRFLGASGLTVGGLSAFGGGILLPFGIYQNASGKRQKRLVAPYPGHNFARLDFHPLSPTAQK